MSIQPTTPTPTKPPLSNKPITFKTYLTGAVLYFLVLILLSVPCFGLVTGIKRLSTTIGYIWLLEFILYPILIFTSSFYSKILLAKCYRVHIDNISNAKLTFYISIMLLLFVVLSIAVLSLQGSEQNDFKMVFGFILLMGIVYWYVTLMILASLIFASFLIFFGFTLADKKTGKLTPLTTYKPHNITFIFLGILFCVVFVGWKNYKLYDSRFETITEIHYEQSRKVKNNPFFIAELVLNSFHQADKSATPFAKSQLNHSINHYINHLPDPSTHPAVIIKSRHDKLSETELQTLMKWVEDGGHLVTYANNIHSRVRVNHWQAMTDRLEALQDDNASVTTIKNDEEIQKYFYNSHRHGRNQLIRYLNLHAINGYDLSSDQAKQKRNEFYDYLNNLDIKLKNVRRERKNNTSIDHPEAFKQADQHYEARAVTRSFFRQNNYIPKTGFITTESGNTLMMNGDILTSIQPNLFYALNPQAKPNQYFNQATPNEIRQYLTQRQSIIQQRIQFLEENQFEHIPNHQQAHKNWDGYFNTTMNNIEDLKAMDLAIDYMQKMDDKVLVSMFSSLSNLLFDCNYGKGRISLINKHITLNPNTDHTTLAEVDESNQGSLTNDKIHVIRTLNHMFNQYTGYDIYSADNAYFLLELTKHDSQVWFLSDDDRIWTGAISEYIPFLGNRANIAEVTNQSPIDLIYRTISGDDYAQKEKKQKKRVKGEFDLP